MRYGTTFKIIDQIKDFSDDVKYMIVRSAAECKFRTIGINFQVLNKDMEMNTEYKSNQLQITLHDFIQLIKQDYIIPINETEEAKLLLSNII